jgi:hypothetical protein
MTDHKLASPQETVSQSAQDAPGSTESRSIHRCEAQKIDGKICGFYVGTTLLDGRWLCHHHRPNKRLTLAPKGTVKVPKPPISSPQNPAEALQLMQWAAGQAARGRISKQHADAVCATCRELRITWAAMDENDATLRRLETLAAKIEAFLFGDPEHAYENARKLQQFMRDADAQEEPVAPEPARLTYPPLKDAPGDEEVAV